MEHIYMEGTLYVLGSFLAARFIHEANSDFVKPNRILDHLAILFWPVFTIIGIVVVIYDYYSEGY